MKGKTTSKQLKDLRKNFNIKGEDELISILFGEVIREYNKRNGI